LEGQKEFELTFDTNGIPQGVTGKSDARKNVIGVAKGGDEDQEGDVSLPQGMSSAMLEELNQLRAEVTELKETLEARNKEIALIKHKNSELLNESKELSRARVKVEQLRNSRKTFSELVRKLENEKADLTLQLEENRQSITRTTEDMRALQEENHRLTKKYKAMKRRASKSIGQRSSMKIMRNPVSGGDTDPDGGDDRPLTEYIRGDNDGAESPEQPISDNQPEINELDVKETPQGAVPEMDTEASGAVTDDKKADPAKKTRRTWFGLRKDT